MGSDTVASPPSVSWAQRNTTIYLAFNIECDKPDIKFEPTSVLFKGIAQDQKVYEVKIPLYAEIIPEESKQVNKGRLIEVVLTKKNSDEGFWPSLTSDKIKHHWLRVDFNKWQDEDESDDKCLDTFSDEMGDFGNDYENDDEQSSGEEENQPDIK